MQHADDLFGDRAGASDNAPGVQVLAQCMHPGLPIHPLVLVKALVLGSNEGLLEEERDLVERDKVMHVPGILERYREGNTTAVHRLGSAGGGSVREERWRERSQRGPGRDNPEENRH